MMLAAVSAEVTTAFIELGAILLGLSLLARGAVRVGFSPIPLYLMGGLVVSAFGLLPARITDDFVELAAEIGVLLLLFVLGLEYTPKELSSELRSNSLGGFVDLVANFGPGLAIGLLLGWDPVAAILLGGVTYISSSRVISKLLDDLDRLGNRETGTILSMLVLEDLVMAVYLPIVGVLLAGTAMVTGLISVGIAMAVVAVIIVFAVRLGPWLSRAIDSESDEVALLSVLGLVLLVGGLAQEVEVSAAVGAFLVGLAISGPAQHHAGALIGPLRDLFAAIFFFVFALGDRALDAAADPVARRGARRGHGSDEGSGRLVGRRSCRRRQARTMACSDDPDRTWRVLGGHRRPRRRRGHPGGAGSADRCVRADPGDRRVDPGPGRAAAEVARPGRRVGALGARTLGCPLNRSPLRRAPPAPRSPGADLDHDAGRSDQLGHGRLLADASGRRVASRSMQEILEAIQSDASGDDIAALALPERPRVLRTCSAKRSTCGRASSPRTRTPEEPARR